MFVGIAISNDPKTPYIRGRFGRGDMPLSDGDATQAPSDPAIQSPASISPSRVRRNPVASWDSKVQRVARLLQKRGGIRVSKTLLITGATDQVQERIARTPSARRSGQEPFVMATTGFQLPVAFRTTATRPTGTD